MPFKNIIKASLTVLLGVILIACGSSNKPASGKTVKGNPFPSAKVQSVQTIMVTVAANKVDCIGFVGPMTCLDITLEDGTNEVLYEGIRGYTHVPGQARKIKVKRFIYDPSGVGMPQDISTVQYVMAG